MKRINSDHEDELLQRHVLERKRLPKILKADTKTRNLMFRESLRISVVNTPHEQEKEKIKKVRDEFVLVEREPFLVCIIVSFHF
jgi:STE20-like kinase